ncbi:MAG: tripartite tricarboxylate transporter substrate binding protein, partial [Reyranella sp.]
MKLTRRTVLAASAATLGSSLAAPAVKASPGWPTRQPIKLIATFPP